MTEGRQEPIAQFGFALGVGVALVPLVGIPLRFAFPELPVLIPYGGAVLLGLLLGLLIRR